MADKLAAKLAGWKDRHVFLAGRTTLVKSVAMVVPPYVMHAFLLLVSMCDKLDRLSWHFLWGVAEEGKMYLFLRNWDKICAPKQVGGLGIRRARDMNIAYVTKLGWKVYIESDRPWVKLIRSKYLRGRMTMEIQRTAQASSWIWNGIKSCKNSLDKSCCYQVGQHSILSIHEDPWLLDLPRHKLPSDIQLPEHLEFVSDLMVHDNSSWDKELIYSIFPENLCKLILGLPIVTREQEQFIWNPPR